MPAGNETRKKPLRWYEKLAGALFFLLAAGTGFAMVLLMGLGVMEIIEAALTPIWGGAHGRRPEPLPGFFHGLDMLLIAPLGYVLVFGIWKYLGAIRDPQQRGLDEARVNLVGVKAFIVGLMAAAVAVHLVEILLTEKEIEATKIGVYCVVVAVLAGYGLLLEALASRHASSVAPAATETSPGAASGVDTAAASRAQRHP